MIRLTLGDGETAIVEILDAVRRIVRALRTGAGRVQREHGISAAQYFVLDRLAEAPAASLNQLAERTMTHQSSVSIVVHRLVARGLVAHRRSSEDRRRIELDLTPAGRALVRRSPPAPQVTLVRGLLRLPAGDRRHLAALLRRLTREMGIAELPPTLLFEEGGSARRVSRHQPRARTTTRRRG